MRAKEGLRKIILNGDDFGFSHGVNRGIIESINKGILTSTSVMVNRMAATEAKELTKIKNISVGLHFDVTEENPLERWTKLFYILTWSKKRIHKEFEDQIGKFHRLVGRLPDHIDSHHHVHRLTGFRSVVSEFGKKHNIPVRSRDASLELGFYGRSFASWTDYSSVSAEKLITVIRRLPPGIHEIMCHPGYVDQELIDTGTLYLHLREAEVKALTSDKVRKFIEGDETIKLINWREI